jgi:hypothetical protein
MGKGWEMPSLHCSLCLSENIPTGFFPSPGAKFRRNSLSALKSDEMRKLARTDLSYHFLQNVRGSPAFFNKMLYDLLGMIRWLGTCTCNSKPFG